MGLASAGKTGWLCFGDIKRLRSLASRSVLPSPSLSQSHTLPMTFWVASFRCLGAAVTAELATRSLLSDSWSSPMLSCDSILIVTHKSAGRYRQTFDRLSAIPVRSQRRKNSRSHGLIQVALKDLFADTLQTMLEGELDAHLGYAKYALQDKQTSNRSNGCSRKP